MMFDGPPLPAEEGPSCTLRRDLSSSFSHTIPRDRFRVYFKPAEEEEFWPLGPVLHMMVYLPACSVPR